MNDVVTTTDQKLNEFFTFFSAFTNEMGRPVRNVLHGY